MCVALRRFDVCVRVHGGLKYCANEQSRDVSFSHMFSHFVSSSSRRIAPRRTFRRNSAQAMRLFHRCNDHAMLHGHGAWERTRLVL